MCSRRTSYDIANRKQPPLWELTLFQDEFYLLLSGAESNNANVGSTSLSCAWRAEGIVNILTTRRNILVNVWGCVILNS
jgi:hypothetical protein